MCSQRGSKQKKVNYECPNFDVGLSSGECFMMYHTMDKFRVHYLLCLSNIKNVFLMLYIATIV